MNPVTGMYCDFPDSLFQSSLYYIHEVDYFHTVSHNVSTPVSL